MIIIMKSYSLHMSENCRARTTKSHYQWLAGWNSKSLGTMLDMTFKQIMNRTISIRILFYVRL